MLKKKKKQLNKKMEKTKKRTGVIAVDFDGTIVTHNYPNIGKDIGAFRVIKKLENAGYDIYLWTMRSGVQLQEAVDYCATNGLTFKGVNKSEHQHKWTDSPKLFADLYIDDAALGTPLTFDEKISSRPFVDWEEVDKWLLIFDYR